MLNANAVQTTDEYSRAKHGERQSYIKERQKTFKI